ncbi:MAG: hypothetical protein EPN60_03310 [Nevskiaceae bacterium]|nr:MAG: hypothetical protein EPO48_13740 [Nevskiaceae bacterium]TAM32779.1 MAG: hypothetical protein EPN60_03310 [Nevskiaceae bacterium]
MRSTSDTDGWIVGSIGASKGYFSRVGSIYNDHKLIFVKINDPGSGGTLTYSPGELLGADKDFNDRTEGSDLFAVRLPSGKYAFVASYFWQNKGTAGTSEVYQSYADVLIFEVRPGITLYMGSFIASNEWPPGYPLRTVPGAPSFTHYLRAERDMPKLREKFGSLPVNAQAWIPERYNGYVMPAAH